MSPSQIVPSERPTVRLRSAPPGSRCCSRGSCGRRLERLGRRTCQPPDPGPCVSPSPNGSQPQMDPRRLRRLRCSPTPGSPLWSTSGRNGPSTQPGRRTSRRGARCRPPPAWCARVVVVDDEVVGVGLGGAVGSQHRGGAAASTPGAASGVKMHSRSIDSGSREPARRRSRPRSRPGSRRRSSPSAPHPVPRTGSAPSRGTAWNSGYGNTVGGGGPGGRPRNGPDRAESGLPRRPRQPASGGEACDAQHRGRCGPFVGAGREVGRFDVHGTNSGEFRASGAATSGLGLRSDKFDTSAELPK